MIKNTPANAGDTGSISGPRTKVPQWEAYTPQVESSPHLPQLKEACAQQQRPCTAKNKYFFKNKMRDQAKHINNYIKC